MEHRRTVWFKVTLYVCFEEVHLWMNDIRKTTSALAPRDINPTTQTNKMASLQSAKYHLQTHGWLHITAISGSLNEIPQPQPTSSPSWALSAIRLRVPNPTAIFTLHSPGGHFWGATISEPHPPQTNYIRMDWDGPWTLSNVPAMN